MTYNMAHNGTEDDPTNGRQLCSLLSEQPSTKATDAPTVSSIIRLLLLLLLLLVVLLSVNVSSAKTNRANDVTVARVVCRAISAIMQNRNRVRVCLSGLSTASVADAEGGVGICSMVVV